MTKYTDLDLVEHLLEEDLDIVGRWENDVIATRSNHLVIVYKYLSATASKQSKIIEHRMEEQWRATIPEIEEELEKRDMREGD